MTIRIVIADDQQLMREGLRTILDLEPDMSVVGTAADGQAAWEQCRDHRPDVVLMDIQMPVMDGVEATRRILEHDPAIHIIALTTFDDDELIIRVLRAGARTYLLKDLASEKLLETIRATVRGDILLQPEIASRLIAAAREPSSHGAGDGLPATMREPLSPREGEILALMVRGMHNREIAADLFLTEGTVKNHISTIYSKLGVRDRTQAVLLALKHDLTSK